jgi:DNA-binding response OmpR family regulator
MNPPPVLGKQILVVDDEEDVRFLVSRMLADMGYDVDMAVDGADAIHKMRIRRPDLLILDLMMPNVDGYGVLGHLRTLPDPPPVVVLTARGDYDSFQRIVREGASAYVSKPFRFHELIATCQSVLMGGGRSHAVPHERRRDPRRVIMAEVKVLSRDQTPIALGELVDLSAGGAQIHLAVRLDVKARIRVALHLPAGSGAFNLEGEVQWQRAVPRGFAHGVAFVDVTPQQQAQLAGLLGSVGERRVTR